MIDEIGGFLFLSVTFLTTAYLVRNLIFTIAVLRHSANPQLKTLDSSCEPNVSILIPAHNEEHVIDRILQRMTELTYPREKLQIIVIDDASTDATGRLAEGYVQKFGYFRALHREAKGKHQGKVAALNDAMKICDGEVVLCFDADYYPQKDIVEKLVRPFADPRVGAVQGRVIVLNEPQNVVTRLVALERIGGYRVDQQARETLGLIPQFWRNDALVETSPEDPKFSWP